MTGLTTRAKLTMAALLALGITGAQAGTYTYNQTITLNPALINTNSGAQYYSQPFNGNTPITLASGDVLTGTFTFANGPVQITDPIGGNHFAIVAFFSPTSGTPSTAYSTSIQLLGLNGTFGNTNPTPLTNSGGGPLFAGALSNGAAYNFTFTGFSYTINITSVANGSVQTSNPFAFSQLSLQGQTLSFVPSATPEPGTWSMLATGCAALLFGARRRRAT